MDADDTDNPFKENIPGNHLYNSFSYTTHRHEEVADCPKLGKSFDF